MVKKIRVFVVAFILFFSSFVLFFSEFSYANNSFVVDFGTPAKYVASLGVIRQNMGTALPNFSTGRIIYQLNSASEVGTIFRIRGVDFYEDESMPDIEFVISPSNLYLAGFIVNQRFFRFSDTRNITIPGVQVVDLNVDSNYTTLTRIANTGRRELSISRASLRDGYFVLNNHGPNNLNLSREEASALLRYITVLPEAVRFRNIQGNFAHDVLGPTSTDYRLSDQAIDLTLNWGGLSEVIPQATTNASTVQTGSVRLEGLDNIARTVGLVLNCPTSSRFRRDVYSKSEECSTGNAVVINGVVWDKRTLVNLF